MKKLSIPGILLASLSILILNSCSKSNEVSSTGNTQDSTSISTAGQNFQLDYLIFPLSNNIVSIEFNEEHGMPQTVYNTDLFPGGIKEMNVTANRFKARMSVIMSNMTGHPIGLRLQIRVNGQVKQSKDFTIPSFASYMNATIEYEVQFD
jgi:hypothetical protein